MRKTILYSIAFIALGCGTGLLGPTLPGLAARTNAEMKQISYLFLARGFGTLIGSGLIGRYYDRIAGNNLLALSLLAAAATLALVPSTQALPVLTALTMFLGIALASINAGGNSLIVRVHSERARPSISALHFAYGLGGYLAPTLFARLERRADGLQLSYWLLALATVPIALATFLSQSPPQRNDRNRFSAARGSALMITLLSAFAFLQSGAEATAMGWYFSYGLGRGLKSSMAAYLNSGFWGAFTFGRLVTIWMSARLSAVSLIIPGLSIGALIGIGMLLSPPSPYFLWIGSIGLGLAIAPVYPNVFGLADRMIGLSGKIMGFLLVGSAIGNMFWPWLTGQYFKSFGPQVMVMVIAVNLLGSLVSISLLLALQARAEDGVEKACSSEIYP